MRLRRRNIIMNMVCILLVLSCIAWGINYFWRYIHYEITNDAMVEQYIMPLNIRASGYIRSVRFTEHQPVRSGDTLIVLDDREYRIRVKDAESTCMDARGAKEVLAASIESAKANIDIQKTAIAETEARLKQQEKDYRRYAMLVGQRAVSRQEYEKVMADYETAKIHLDALRKQENAARLHYEETRKRLTGAEANILRCEVALEKAKLELSYTVLKAPFDGVMGRRSLETGQLVQAGQTVSYLVRSNDKWVTANYRETQIADIRIGQEVRIRVDAFRGRVFHGTVVAISEATGSKYALVPTDNAAGNFVKVQQRIPVRIRIDDASPEEMSALRAGMMVETEVLRR